MYNWPSRLWRITQETVHCRTFRYDHFNFIAKQGRKPFEFVGFKQYDDDGFYRTSRPYILHCPRGRRTFKESIACFKTESQIKHEESLVETCTSEKFNVRRAELKPNVLQDEPESGVVSVLWSNGEKESYPYVFLRNNCQCPLCCNPVSKQRVMKPVDLSTCPKSLLLDKTTDAMHIVWHDHHKSTFSPGVLREMKHSANWKSELNTDTQSVNFDEVLNHYKTMYQNVTERSKGFLKLGRRFGYIR